MRSSFPSSSWLVATVVPWLTAVIASPDSPSPSSTLRTPVRKPSAGSAGVDGVLVVVLRPVSSSTATTSVNVPPVSMPIRTRRGGALIAGNLRGEIPAAGRSSRPPVARKGGPDSRGGESCPARRTRAPRPRPARGLRRYGRARLAGGGGRAPAGRRLPRGRAHGGPQRRRGGFLPGRGRRIGRGGLRLRPVPLRLRPRGPAAAPRRPARLPRGGRRTGRAGGVHRADRLPGHLPRLRRRTDDGRGRRRAAAGGARRRRRRRASGHGGRGADPAGPGDGGGEHLPGGGGPGGPAAGGPQHGVLELLGRRRLRRPRLRRVLPHAAA